MRGVVRAPESRQVERKTTSQSPRKRTKDSRQATVVMQKTRDAEEFSGAPGRPCSRPRGYSLRKSGVTLPQPEGPFLSLVVPPSRPGLSGSVTVGRGSARRSRLV